ncbi:MAG: DUF5606 domain-containing protein [Rikenellaceae bacterium]
MKLNEVLAITGKPGLYRYVAQGMRGGVIVESLAEGKRLSIGGREQISALSEISMFTEGDDMPLSEIYQRLIEQTAGAAAISHKESSDKIREAFEQLLPEYDRERVHISDMKKCFNWFNTLIAAGATSFEVERAEQPEEPTEE